MFTMSASTDDPPITSRLPLAASIQSYGLSNCVRRTASVRRRGHDPEAYLTDIIRHLPTTPATAMHPLAPSLVGR